MKIVYTLFFFITGSALASFLNAQMYRWQNGYRRKEFLTTPSQCEYCKKKLKWYELIPIISYILQKGKCQKCKNKISVYYPLSELFLGISFLLFFSLNLFSYMYIVLLLLFMMSYWDYVVMGVPRILAHILLVFSVVIFIHNYSIHGYLLLFNNGLLTGILFSLMFCIGNLFYKNKKAFGLGDMFVILSVCLVLDFRQSIIFVFSSVLISSIYGICFALKNKRDLKFYVPFIVFLLVGFLISLTCTEFLFIW